MAETAPRTLWLMRLTYLGLGVLILFFNLLPLQPLPQGWAFPDVFLALTFAWALRRPEYIPALSIASAWLLADLILHRPPGLMAALVLLATEVLKPRTTLVRDEGYVSELVSVSIMMALVTFGNLVILAVLLVPTPALGVTVVQLLATIACYPLVVLISRSLFGVRAKAPGDTATGGLGA